MASQLDAGTNEKSELPLGGDGPLSDTYGQVTRIPPRQRRLHDPLVMLEEYEHYAAITRQQQEEDFRNNPPPSGIKAMLFPPKSTNTFVETENKYGDNSPSDGSPRRGSRGSLPDVNVSSLENRIHISDEEWTNASRALRTASWAACFYLITTDILGPFGIGFSIGLLGWGPGIALFTVFGLMAGYSGYLLWNVFLHLDSYEFPCKNYGDLAFRLYGNIPRFVVNFLQSVQLLLSVGVITIGNGLAISQVSKLKLCFAVCCLIWALAGFAIGQVRTLQKFGWLANFAIVINLMIMFISMGVMAHSPPNFAIAPFGSVGSTLGEQGLYTATKGIFPPVVHSAGMPASTNGFVGAINGLMQGVYAYAGAQLFIEFMAEMRRPRDFIKAMWGAQFFIYSVYMIYGSYCYFWQGQYTNQGVSPYAWQTVGNILAVISGIIAACLYGNIGIKVIYNNFLMEYLRAPPLTTKQGKILWAAIVPIYWIIAFIVAAAIPDFFGLTSIVAAVCFTQFTYTFPPILALGHAIQHNAIRSDEGFNPVTGEVIRHDRGIKRWARGFMAGRWYINVWHVIYAGGALATSGLGAYSAIEGLIAAFKSPQINSFTCTSPLAGQ